MRNLWFFIEVIFKLAQILDPIFFNAVYAFLLKLAFRLDTQDSCCLVILVSCRQQAPLNYGAGASTSQVNDNLANPPMFYNPQQFQQNFPASLPWNISQDLNQPIHLNGDIRLSGLLVFRKNYDCITMLYLCIGFSWGVGNCWPAGHMWSTKAFAVACGSIQEKSSNLKLPTYHNKCQW